MQPSLEQRAALVLGLTRGTTRLDEIMARHGVSRSTVAIWVQQMVHAAPEHFDPDMLAVLRTLGLIHRDAHPQQTGRIQQVQPLDLLQSLNIYSGAGRVLFFHPHGIAEVWFEHGELIDAVSGQLRGAAAVHRIAGLEAGDFRVDVTGESRPRTIEGPISALLLEAARRKDEARVVLDALPPPGTVLAAAADAEPKGLGTYERTVLEQIGAGATVGEVVERSPLDELSTLRVLESLHRDGVLRPTGQTRLPEVPSVERRIHALERASAEVSPRSRSSTSIPVRVRVSTSQDLRIPSGPFPPPPRLVLPPPRVLAAAAAVLVLLVVVLVVALGGDDQADAPEAGPVVDAAAVAQPPPPPCPPSMVLLPEVELFVGSDLEALEAAPVHQVWIPALCIDRHEVTAADYRACVEAGACTSTIPEVPPPDPAARPRKAGPDPGPDPRCTEGEEDRQAHPINCLTWEQADALCRHQGKRLPTEAQWERAARSVEGRRYPWGNDPPNADRLNACGRECTEGVPAYGEPDPHLATAPVGHYADGMTPEGVHDMAGNVREWTADGFRRYAAGPAEDPRVPSADGDRVVRGGCFTTTDRLELESAYRRRMAGDATSPEVGLRCVGDPTAAVP